TDRRQVCSGEGDESAGRRLRSLPTTDPSPAVRRLPPVSRKRRVQFLEVPPVARLALWKEPIDFTRRHGTVLEAPLREDRHVDAEHRANPAGDDVTLERVEALSRALRERGEWNRLRDRDDLWPRVRTERGESMLLRARIAADATATVPARIGERVLDGFDS